MASIKNRVVFITGASSGIGKACAYAFADKGANLILSARRIDTVNEISEDIRKNFSVNVYSFKLDVRNYEDVKVGISSLPNEFKKIDILINNAGLARGLNNLYEDNPDGWDEMIDTNIKGLLNVTKEVVKEMAEKKTGHVINIGSIAGHIPYTKAGVYCSTKYAVKAITNTLRMEVLDKKIRVSTVDPGAVETEFAKVRFYEDEERAKNIYKGFTPLAAEDVAQAVIFCATRPSHVNINEIIIMPSAQAASTVINRED